MHFKTWVLLALLAAVVIGGGLYGVEYFRHRFVRKNGDLVKLLPPGDLTLSFADLRALRQAGMLRLLANVKPASDKEYENFIRVTQFDVARDLDALAGAYDIDHLYFVGRGHFDWNKLQSYAVSHGGTCGEDFCQEPGTTPGKWANFVLVQPDVLALAVSRDRDGADALRPPGRRVQESIPNAPVWLKLSHALRTNPSDLPLLVQIFAISVQSAEDVLLFVQPAQSASFEIHLKADFENASAADTARSQLARQTKKLKEALLQDGQKVDAANAASLLVGGWFQSKNTLLTGGWPVSKELLASLQ